MKNSLVARILNELADYAEIDDEQPYRARAYRRASQTIGAIPEAIEDISKQGKLQDLPGVGDNIEKKIDEILKTGKLQALEKLKQKIPADVGSLTRIEGIGPKTVKELYQKVGIKNLDDFETAIKTGKLKDFRGLGVKSEELLLQRIENARTQRKRILLVEAEFLAKRVSEQVSKIPNITRFEIAGSYRRKKETIGDLDVLIETEEPSKSVDYFTKWDEVKNVLSAGELKASVEVENNLQVDIRVVPTRSWGAALLYFTGSKAHNIELRTIAIRKGLKLSEWGLFKVREGKEELPVAGSTEEEVYRALDMDYIEPELRENRGEIQAAQYHRLPKLIRLEDIKGDLQMHTIWSDGREEIINMAEKSQALGYEYIAITDHVGSLKIANALDESRIRKQAREIQKLNEKYEKSGKNFHILHGCEVNIKSDGRLDFPNSSLKELDFVLAAIHSGFKQDIEQITNRLASAMENEYVDEIAHPTGRLILERTGYKFDFQRVIQEALETDTMLEIDGYPNRLDLDDENAREAIKSGIKMTIDTDAHDTSELEYMHQGIFQARRSWAEKEHIVNTLGHKDLIKFIGK